MFWRSLARLAPIYAALIVSVQGFDAAPLSVKHVENEMIKVLHGSNACWRLLSINGSAGCAGPDLDVARAPIQHWTGDEEIDGDRTMLVPAKLAAQFLNLYLSDSGIKNRVHGILIDARDHPEGLSFAAKFPGKGFPSETFPYDHSTYEWNPAGSDIRLQELDVPVFILDDELADVAEKSATENARKGFSKRANVAEMRVSMEGKSSPGCLETGTCDPLGGHSILAVSPPLTNERKPVVMIASHIDTAGLFLDQVVGADSALSGLIAMLVAADLLKGAESSESDTHRIAFNALAGEPWGYMGSKRMMWELGEGKEFSNNTVPFNLDDVEKFIEIGAVGLAGRGNDQPKMYLHQQKVGSFIDSNETTDALKASAAEDDLVSVEDAAATTPGIPPSSLMMFLSRNSSLEGVVLAEYNEKFINPYFESYLDDERNIDIDSITAAAVLVAKSAHSLAGRSGTLEVDVQGAKELTSDLVDCLVKADPSLNCKLATDMMTVTQSSYGLVEHYVGVIKYQGRHSQDHLIVKNIERFVFTFLGERVAVGQSDGDCNEREKTCDDSQVCLGEKFDAGEDGKCWDASVYFVPSYPLSVLCTNCTLDSPEYIGFTMMTGQQLTESNISTFVQKYGWAPEPLWMESRWEASTPHLRLYHRESKSTETAIMVIGILMLVFTALAAGVSKVVFEKRVKQS
ncbi:hypothetical protein BSKO_04323 [Bryopsis sp. KO-2023]|nr:hypothetical protein BSKO_04323 [Bryopsis sp. KO-2023]